MESLKFGDIVLIKFPFTDQQGFKKRPALVLQDSTDGDVVVCRITSKIYESSFDIQVKNWEKCGLRLPSVIRVHKIATLEKGLVDSKIGKLDLAHRNQVKRLVKKIAG